MSFTQFNFNTRISEVLETLGYTSPTPIQEKVIPVLLKEKKRCLLVRGRVIYRRNL